MKKWTPITLAVLAILAVAPVFAQGTNPEDEPLDDTDAPTLAAPEASPSTSTEATTTLIEIPGELPNTTSTSTPNATATTPVASGEMVTIPREVWEQLQRDVAALKTAQTSAVAPVATPSVAPAETPEAAPETTSANRNYLALPDISFVMQAKGLLSSDKRDPDQRRLNLSEGELSIQGYVYPGVKAEAFLVGSPAEDAPFQIEEGFLTFQGVRKGLNINVGRKFAPFGRTGELHNHSWLYPRQLIPIRNLVSEEALVGDGVNFNYLFPLKGKTFLRGSFGVFSGEGSSTRINLSNPSDPFFGGVPGGTGAGYDRFYNGRLWAGRSLGEDGEIEFGVSHARGSSNVADDADNISNGRVNLTGADLSYRKFMNGGKRLLLRSEYFKYNPRNLPTVSASGYYALANLKLDPRKDIGLLYEKSGFPNAPGENENAFSAIYTKQLTEQFYMRLMGTRGNRAGDSYNELRLQFTAGLGPHTHALE